MNERIGVGILGARGFGAGELLRLLASHDGAEVVSLASRRGAGSSVASVHPHLARFYDDVTIAERLDLDRLLDRARAVVFSALPHGASASAIDTLLVEREQRAGRADLCVIDLSGDFRLRAPEIHARFYPDSPAPASLRARFTYGLPELFAERIAGARLIANPGCLATASILATAPLLAESFSGMVAVDVNTGSSGSGREPQENTHHSTRHADFRAYAPLAHRHEPEVLQALGDPIGRRIELSFVPHSLPTARGIFVTAHLTLARATDADALRRRYATFYEKAPFVRMVEVSPSLENVVATNFCDLSLACRSRQVIAMAAIDNLGKGMAGTAIQNMNLAFGLPQTRGLWFPAPRPI